MSATTTKMTRVMHLMNESGHTSFGWDPEDDQWVLPMIRLKMAAGFTFWIVRRNPLREVELKRIEELGDVRNVIIKDQASRELFEAGRIGIATSGDEAELRVSRRAATAEEAVREETVVHRPLRGG